MSITALRTGHRAWAIPLRDHRDSRAFGPVKGDLFAIALLRAGQISAAHLLQALAGQHQGRLIDSLLATGAMPPMALYAAFAQHYDISLADFDRFPPDPTLMHLVDPALCLQQNWLPWRRLGPTVVITCAYPQEFAARKAEIETTLGPVIVTAAPRAQIEAAILARAGAQLAHRAETRLDLADSCRSYKATPLIRAMALLALALAGLAQLAPWVIFPLALILAWALILVQTALGLAAVLAKARPKPPRPSGLHLVPDPEPMISVIVALYKESRIVARLIRRLAALDYPRDKMEVIFVTEAGDTATAQALAGLDLPQWLRVLPVPSGTIRTKPRALNYALDHCRGTIIGVYDAEDAPARDQLRIVADRFACGDDRLACLQGRLDFYNPRANALARCFTIDYAAWWRVFLPGIERLGLALPLGGTTLFFRRDILQSLGAWDAHNVTEDADLGFRLARRGYCTELIDSVTYEEANCAALPWIKQRSRWIKGYMMTWATHMRDPARLWRDLGPRRFVGFQIMVAGSVLGALLAPVLWAFWLLPVFGASLPASVWLTCAAVLIQAFVIGCNAVGLKRAGHRMNPLWLLAMIPYHMLSTLAAYKALWEMLAKPFYWDKTNHGVFDMSLARSAKKPKA